MSKQTDSFVGQGSLPGKPDAYFITPEGKVEEARPANGKDFKVDELNRIVGGHIQLVPLNGDRYMVVNEDGKGDRLPLNPNATVILHEESGAMRSDYVVGAVLVCPQRMIE